MIDLHHIILLGSYTRFVVCISIYNHHMYQRKILNKQQTCLLWKGQAWYNPNSDVQRIGFPTHHGCWVQIDKLDLY